MADENPASSAPASPQGRVLSHIRRFRSAEVVAPSGAWPRRGFVIDGRTGKLVMALPPAAIKAESLTLGIPEQAPGNVELLCTPEPADDPRDGAVIDRWSAYHGQPAGVMSLLTPLAAKLDGLVVDSDELTLTNPLQSVESRLVRFLNGQRPALIRWVLTRIGVELIEPTVVGVDATGIDVRTRIGVLRVPVEVPASSEEAATEALSAMLTGSSDRR